MIELKNVQFGYTFPLVTVEKLSLQKGEIYALLGRNGKGKSTIISTINGHTNAIAGKILLNQTAISALNIIERAQLVASVGSKFDGVDHLSVKDYIALGRTPYLNFLGKLKADDEQIIEEISKRLQIEHLLTLQSTKISDGERQLAAIGRALVQETPIITLDEPTAFLDYINKKNLIQQLKRITTEMEKCILFSTHDIELCFENEVSIIYINRAGELQKFQGNTKEDLLQLAFED